MLLDSTFNFLSKKDSTRLLLAQLTIVGEELYSVRTGFTCFNTLIQLVLFNHFQTSDLTEELPWIEKIIKFYPQIKQIFQQKQSIVDFPYHIHKEMSDVEDMHLSAVCIICINTACDSETLHASAYTMKWNSKYVAILKGYKIKDAFHILVLLWLTSN